MTPMASNCMARYTGLCTRILPFDTQTAPADMSDARFSTTLHGSMSESLCTEPSYSASRTAPSMSHGANSDAQYTHGPRIYPTHRGARGTVRCTLYDTSMFHRLHRAPNQHMGHYRMLGAFHMCKLNCTQLCTRARHDKQLMLIAQLTRTQ